MTEQMLIQKWLWMQTMNYAIKSAISDHKRTLYPMETEQEWRFVGWEVMQKNILKYTIEHWDEIEDSYSGSISGDSRYDIGYWLERNSKGCSGEYKNFKVEIKWSEVKAFIKELLDEEKYHQMDLLDILAMAASK